MSLQDCLIKRRCNERKKWRTESKKRKQARKRRAYMRQYERTYEGRNRYMVPRNVLAYRISVINHLEFTQDMKNVRIAEIISQERAL